MPIPRKKRLSKEFLESVTKIDDSPVCIKVKKMTDSKTVRGRYPVNNKDGFLNYYLGERGKKYE